MSILQSKAAKKAVVYVVTLAIAFGVGMIIFGVYNSFKQKAEDKQATKETAAIEYNIDKERV